MSEEDTNLHETPKEPTEQVGEPEPSTDGVRTRKKSGLSSVKVKLIVVFLIIAVALTIGLWGGAPENYKSLEEVLENQSTYLKNEAQVVGTVANWTGGRNFTLMDRDNNTVEIFVVHEKEIPDGFAESKDVVVTGKLEETSNGLILRSKKPIVVGCPSKY
jgi:cytochrome c-type biogenesis protein CcmE